MEISYVNNHKSLFRKYARLVTWFANTQLGRDYLKHNNLYIPNEKLELLLPNGYVRRYGNNRQLIVSTRPIFAPKLYPALQVLDFFNVSSRESIDLIFWYLGLRVQPIWATNKLFLTLNVNPDAHPETTTVDGSIYRNIASQTWAQIIVGTANTTADDTTTDNARFPTCQKDGDSSFDFYQWFVNLYDTSSLTAAATISDAKVKFYGQTKTSTGPTFSGLGLVLSNPASNTSLAGSDYPSKTLTRQATDIARAAWSTGAYNEFTLNATGLGNIAKTGITKFGLVSGNEIDNSEPSGGGAGQSDLFDGYAAGGDNPPVLTVTYTLPESSSVSPSVSPSESSSISPSGSESQSQSPSGSQSPSASESASQSPSLSQSPSGSESNSSSKSESSSLSPSASASPSESASISPSPAEYMNKYSIVGNTYTDKYTSTL